MSTIAERWTEQALQRGIQQGLQQGLMLGLSRMLEAKFGEGGRAFAEELRPMATETLVEELSLALLGTESLAELRERFLPPPP